jgi:DNA repair exonuclease SbcCD ATPase subunit
MSFSPVLVPVGPKFTQQELEALREENAALRLQRVRDELDGSDAEWELDEKVDAVDKLLDHCDFLSRKLLKTQAERDELRAKAEATDMLKERITRLEAKNAGATLMEVSGSCGKRFPLLALWRLTRMARIQRRRMKLGVIPRR